ncbi:putative reverse transcriptase domain-containing protein [Tanacetum coccineum]
MTLYNALPRKEYEHVFMCKTAKEVWHTLIITHQGNSQVKNCKIDLLTQDYNHVRKFLRALPLKWRAKVTSIKESKYLATLPLDELIGNVKIYEMILASDGVASKPIKEKVMPIALKANVTRGQTSNDSVCQDGSDEDEQEEFNSIVKNLWKLFKNGNRFERENHFGNGRDRFNRGHGNRSKGVGSSRGKCNCYGCGSKTHLVDDCPKVKMQKAFVGGAWSDSEYGDQIEKDATFLMAIDSQKVNLNPS